MTLILQVFYSVFSGLLLALAIPNELILFGSPFIAFISIIPLYLAFTKSKGFLSSVLCSFLQTLTVHLISSFWLGYFKDFAAFTLGASAFGTSMIGAGFGLLFYLPYSRDNYHPLDCYSLSKPFYRNNAFRVIYFACVYICWEWVKSVGFIGYPWGTVSSAMFRFNALRQISALTGTFGISFLAVLFSALLAQGFIQYFSQDKALKLKDHYYDLGNAAAVFVVFFVLSVIYGDYQYNKIRTPVKTLNTVMVQQNSDPWKSNSDDQSILTSERLTTQAMEDFKKDGKQTQLVVWSEGVLTRHMPFSKYHYTYYPQEKPLISFIKEIKAPLLVGGSYYQNIDDDTKKFFNAAHVFDSDGNFRGYYGKLHLVPFAESIPGMNNPKIRALVKKFVGISAGWNQGEQLIYFDIPCSYYNDNFHATVDSYNLGIPYDIEQELKTTNPTVRICTPICFDDSFTDVIRPLFLNGAEAFINITDDSWSLKDSSEIQHFVIASYRAIEYRTTLVRSTNAGYSVVLDPSGKILADMPLFQECSKAVEVPVYPREITLYAKFGNWFPYSCLIFVALIAFIMFLTFETTDYIPSERKNKYLKKSFKKNKDRKSKKKNKKSSSK